MFSLARMMFDDIGYTASREFYEWRKGQNGQKQLAFYIPGTPRSEVSAK